MWISIFSAFLIAVIISGFQYLHKQKDYFLFLLRTIVYFLIFILLLDPKIEQQKKQESLPNLYVLADQSKSIQYLKQENNLKKIITYLKGDKELNKKFATHYYGFDNQVFSLDTLSFKGENTDINQALQRIKNITPSENNTPVILISDGNTNQGKDYAYSLSKQDKLKIYPIILGDTTQYENIVIDRINVNPVVLQGNSFPVEIFINYEGKKKVKTDLILYENKKIIYKEKLNLVKNNLVKTIYLKGEKKGIHHYKVVLKPLKKEKNTADNQSYFSIEVIDQNKKIGIFSDIIHPDIGFIRRVLKQNKYYQVKFIDLNQPIKKKEKFDALVLYQPNDKIEKFFKNKELSKKNWLIITGIHTDWNWINNQKLFFQKNNSQSTEEYFPLLNKNFNLFQIPKIPFQNLPPLIDLYGKTKINTGQIALFSKIQNIETQEPLIAFNTQPKQAMIAGENLWQWNMSLHNKEEQNKLAEFIKKIIQYISIKQNFNKIKINYKKNYYSGEKVLISAKVLDENLENNKQAKVFIKLYKNQKLIKKVPLTQTENAYEISFNDLDPGTYYFKISDEKSQANGSFVIRNQNIENIQNRPNTEALKTLSEQTGGEIFYPSNYEKLINDLLKSDQYPIHYQYITKKISLIDYKLLLFFIIFLLSVEWMLKKLQGRI